MIEIRKVDDQVFVLGVLISHFSMIFLFDWNCVVLYVFPYIGTCFVF